MKLTQKTTDELAGLLKQVEKRYSEKALQSELEAVLQDALSKARSELMKDGKTDYYRTYEHALKQESIAKIAKIVAKRGKEQEKMTIGELIEHLSKFDKDKLVEMSVWVDEGCNDSGTDFSGFEPHIIQDIQDLDTRIVITINR